MIVVVEDSEDPVVDCSPGYHDLVTDPSQCSFMVLGEEFDPPFKDNCTIDLEISHDFEGILDKTTLANAQISHGITDVTWVVTDGSGNTNECVVTFEISDREKPGITCENQVVPLMPGSQDCSANISIDLPEVTDNCSANENITLWNNYTDGPNASGIYDVGKTEVHYTATDEQGNTGSCTFTVDVIDPAPPEITYCPEVDPVQAETGSDSAFVSVPLLEASDNCGILSITNSYNGTIDATDDYPVGTTNVTWTVTDIYGLTNSCIQIITVNGGDPCEIELDSTGLGNPSTIISFDGWATFSIAGGTSPFNVYIDGNLVGTVNTQAFNIEGFGPGVFLIYVVDAENCMSNEVELTFTVTCTFELISFSGPDQNGTWVELYWDDTTTVSPFTLYRNNEVIQNNIPNGFYYEVLADPGNYSYQVVDAVGCVSNIVTIIVNQFSGRPFIPSQEFLLPEDLITFEWNESWQHFNEMVLTNLLNEQVDLDKLSGIQFLQDQEMIPQDEEYFFQYPESRRMGLVMTHNVKSNIFFKAGYTNWKTSGHAFMPVMQENQDPVIVFSNVKGNTWSGRMNYHLGKGKSRMYFGIGALLSRITLDVDYSTISGNILAEPDHLFVQQLSAFVSNGLQIRIDDHFDYNIEADFLFTDSSGKWEFNTQKPVYLNTGLKFRF